MELHYTLPKDQDLFNPSLQRKQGEEEFTYEEGEYVTKKKMYVLLLR